LKFTILTLLAVACPFLCQGQTGKFACPSGYEDMMNYFVMAYPARVDTYMAPGNANPIYSSIVPDDATNNYAASGYFVWTKSLVGYPWDIKIFDTKYVYDRTTELSWTDPATFKRFDNDLPMTRRCVRIGKSGATIRVPAANTTYQTFSQCQPSVRQPLGYVVNSISAPVVVNLTTVGPVQTRYFTYKYSCNQNYSACQYMEVFSLGYGIGLYDWKYYVRQKNGLVLTAESIIDNEQGGQTTPSLPCVTSYQ
jgi:hypothetical protein